MIKVLCTIPDPGYAPAFRFPDNPELNHATNTSGLVYPAMDAKFSMRDIKLLPFYNDGKEIQCVELNLDVYLYVDTNYNGYKLSWTSDRDYALENNQMSLGDYWIWKEQHIAVPNKPESLWKYIKR